MITYELRTARGARHLTYDSETRARESGITLARATLAGAPQP